MALRRAVFLDKDGTLVENVPYNSDPARASLCAGAAEGLRMLQQEGFQLIVVTNQSGVARGYFPESALAPMFSHIRHLLECEGVMLGDFYFCPHHPDGTLPQYTLACTCRKPLPGMLLAAAKEHQIDLPASWMIGDILHDVECGHRAGCRTVLINNGNETEWQFSDLRTPDLIAADLRVAAALICGDASMSEASGARITS